MADSPRLLRVASGKRVRANSTISPRVKAAKTSVQQTWAGAGRLLPKELFVLVARFLGTVDVSKILEAARTKDQVSWVVALLEDARFVCRVLQREGAEPLMQLQRRTSGHAYARHEGLTRALLQTQISLGPGRDDPGAGTAVVEHLYGQLAGFDKELGPLVAGLTALRARAAGFKVRPATDVFTLPGAPLLLSFAHNWTRGLRSFCILESDRTRFVAITDGFQLRVHGLHGSGACPGELALELLLPLECEQVRPFTSREGGIFVATVSRSCVQVWSVPDGKRSWTIWPPMDQSFVASSFTQLDDDVVAIGDTGGAIQLHNIGSDKVRTCLAPGQGKKDACSHIEAANFADGRRWIAAASLDKIVLYDTVSLRHVRSYVAETEVGGFCFRQLHNGTPVLTYATVDGEVRAINEEKASELWAFKSCGRVNALEMVDVAGRELLVVSYASGRTLGLRAATGAVQWEMQPGETRALPSRAVVCGSVLAVVATASRFGGVKLWSASSWQGRASTLQRTDPVGAIAVVENSAQVVFSVGPQVAVWSYEPATGRGNVISRYTGHKAPVQDITTLRRGGHTFVISVDFAECVHVYSLRGGVCILGFRLPDPADDTEVQAIELFEEASLSRQEALGPERPKCGISATLMPSGDVLVTCCRAGMLLAFSLNLESGSVTKSPRAVPASLRALSQFHGGKPLRPYSAALGAAFGTSGEAAVGAAAKNLLRVFALGADSVVAVSSARIEICISGGEETGPRLVDIPARGAAVLLCCALRIKGRPVLISYHTDLVFRFWDPSSGALRGSAPSPVPHPVSCIAPKGDGSAVLVLGLQNGNMCEVALNIDLR